MKLTWILKTRVNFITAQKFMHLKKYIFNSSEEYHKKTSRNSYWRCSINICRRVSFLTNFFFMRNETLPQVFTCAFWEIFESTFFTEILGVTASENLLILKSGSHLPKKFCIIFLNENPLKVMKNAFYFILKSLFNLKLFKLLSRLFGHVGKTTGLER